MTTNPKDKIKCWELLSQGHTVSEVCQSMPWLVRRTVQRWKAEFVKQNPGYENLGKVPLVPVTPVVAVTPDISQEESQQEEWYLSAEANNQEILNSSRQIRRKLTDALLQIVEYPELNIRAIVGLSTAIKQHLEIERAAGFYDLLDINKACQLVESKGFIISDPSELGTE